MLEEETEATVLRVFEAVWNRRELSLVDETHTRDYVLHDPANPGVHGRQGYVQMVTVRVAAFPDARFDVEDLISIGEKVVARFTFTATHRGQFLGIPATARTVRVSGISLFRMGDGSIAEEWCQWDTLGLLRQIGGL